MKSSPTELLFIFDFMRTLYDPETRQVIAGAEEVLMRIQQRGHTCYLVSREEGQRAGLVEKLGLRPYFTDVFLTTNKQQVFADLRARQENATIWVIGDRVRGEIRYGNEIGAVTVWYQVGAFAHEEPGVAIEKPDFVINNLTDVLLLTQ